MKTYDKKRLYDYEPNNIKEYLDKFRQCILEGRYSISLNKNRQRKY